jgi:hypothetical protein
MPNTRAPASFPSVDGVLHLLRWSTTGFRESRTVSSTPCHPAHVSSPTAARRCPSVVGCCPARRNQTHSRDPGAIAHQQRDSALRLHGASGHTNPDLTQVSYGPRPGMHVVASLGVVRVDGQDRALEAVRCPALICSSDRSRFSRRASLNAGRGHGRGDSRKT